MRYAWKVSPLRHVIFDTDKPIVLGGRAMALDRRDKRIRGKVVAASPQRVVLKTSRGTCHLSRSTWTIAPIAGETRMPEYVRALLKGLAAPGCERQRSAEKN
jgi:hypothetical protein